jgi:hypothetical protein
MFLVHIYDVHMKQISKYRNAKYLMNYKGEMFGFCELIFF